MSAGFNSPQILFLNTWDQPERDYLYPIFKKLREEHGYTRFVEPCAGAFVMPSVAAEAGWVPQSMETSDVSLFSAVCGYAFEGKPLDDLDIRVDGQPMLLERTDLYERSAEVLYNQLVLRMEQKPDRVYWAELMEDLVTRRSAHIDSIALHVRKVGSRLRGLNFRPLDIWEHVEEVADDPHTVISVNPPTYKGGFEKFYDTGGRLTWAEPRYQIFDAAQDVFKLLELMQGRRALILCQQQQTPGNAGKFPVYARFLSPGQNVYICTNRPSEVVPIAGGLKVSPGKAVEISRLNIPTISDEDAITPDSNVQFMRVGQKEATYYRDLWMHKLDFKGAGAYLAVVIDGKIAGLMGYDPSPILRPYSPKWKGAMLMTFAVGAPYPQRLTRLITMFAINKPTLEIAVNPQINAMAEQIITVELTRHPEAKGLRGLMKLDSRVEDKKYGYKLVYQAEFTQLTTGEVVSKWLQKEIRYQVGQRSQRRNGTEPRAAVG